MCKENTDIIEKCKKIINDAEIILIGIGNEFQVNNKEFLEQSPVYNRIAELLPNLDNEHMLWIEDTVISRMVKKEQCMRYQKVFNTYNKIAEYFKDRNYYVVTTCNDDIIFDSKIVQEKLVAPCGTARLMKCNYGCFKTVYDTKEVYDNIENIINEYLNEKELMSVNEDGLIKEFENKIKDAVPQCPMCKRIMSINKFGTDHYSEEGYKDKWDEYMAWLQRTLNKRLVMLELGEDFKTPTVIRWPFEKVAGVNNKACLIRVNKRFPQIGEGIEAKAVPVKMSGIDFMETITA